MNPYKGSGPAGNNVFEFDKDLVRVAVLDRSFDSGRYRLHFPHVADHNNRRMEGRRHAYDHC